jgi:hypothetical protein
MCSDLSDTCGHSVDIRYYRRRSCWTRPTKSLGAYSCIPQNTCEVSRLNRARFRRRRLRISIRAIPVVLGSDAFMHIDDKLKTEAAREKCKGAVRRKRTSFGRGQNGARKLASMQNSPPAGVFLVLNLIFLRKYLLCNQVVRESGLARNQEAVWSNHTGRIIESITCSRDYSPASGGRWAGERVRILSLMRLQPIDSMVITTNDWFV